MPVRHEEEPHRRRRAAGPLRQDPLGRAPDGDLRLVLLGIGDAPGARAHSRPAARAVPPTERDRAARDPRRAPGGPAAVGREAPAVEDARSPRDRLPRRPVLLRRPHRTPVPRRDDVLRHRDHRRGQLPAHLRPALGSARRPSRSRRATTRSRRSRAKTRARTDWSSHERCAAVRSGRGRTPPSPAGTAARRRCPPRPVLRASRCAPRRSSLPGPSRAHRGPRPPVG